MHSINDKIFVNTFVSHHITYVIVAVIRKTWIFSVFIFRKNILSEWRVKQCVIFGRNFLSSFWRCGCYRSRIFLLRSNNLIERINPNLDPCLNLLWFDNWYAGPCRPYSFSVNMSNSSLFPQISESIGLTNKF